MPPGLPGIPPVAAVTQAWRTPFATQWKGCSSAWGPTEKGFNYIYPSTTRSITHWFATYRQQSFWKFWQTVISHWSWSRLSISSENAKYQACFQAFRGFSGGIPKTQLTGWRQLQQLRRTGRCLLSRSLTALRFVENFIYTQKIIQNSSMFQNNNC